LKDKLVSSALIFFFTLSAVFSQSGKVIPDSLGINQDTTKMQVAQRLFTTISSNAMDVTVEYKSKGYKKNDLANKKVFLIDEAEVTYGDIYLKADSIMIDMENGVVYASGRRDSTGKVSGKALFREKQDSYEVDSLMYNFNTRRAIIYKIITKQEEGYLHSNLTKKQDDETLHFQGSSFTTCDAEHPHFSIQMPKAKVYPNERVVSGPAYLVIEDIPLPLVFPFGYFPFQKKLASGIIMPRYGQEQQRGYFLADGGYYFAGTDYFDLALTGSIYTNGTWLTNFNTGYNLRYKFSGSLNFSYANNIDGHKGLPDYNKSTNYSLRWSHSQDSKSNPTARLSANVSMSSSGYDKNNSYKPVDLTTTQKQSSVSYSKSWPGTPFNMSTSMNHSQNNANQTVSVNLPKATFNMNRINPLKRKSAVGKARWYEDLQLQYTAQVDNRINTYDSILFTSDVWKDANAGFKHDIPLSLQIRPFSNMSISTSVRYSGVLYPQKIEKTWDPNYFDPELNAIVPSVVTDTITGLAYGHSVSPSVSASFSPQIIGLFQFKNQDSRWRAVRHVIRPSASFSFIPAARGLATPMWQEVQVDTAGNFREYSIFENGIYGTPSLSNKSGNISFSLVNTLEAKVFGKRDTTGTPNKIKLIENLSFGTSYNIFADSMKWSPVNMSFQTQLFNQVNIRGGGLFSMYGIDQNGKTVGDFALQKNHKLLYLKSINASLDFDLGQLLRGGKKGDAIDNTPQPTQSDPFDPEAPVTPGSDLQSNQGGLSFDRYGYAIVDLPWTLFVAYNFNYSKPGLVSTINQQFTLNGSLKIATKTDLSFSSGYDISMKAITVTRIGINRNLHCWNMSLNWTPVGPWKSWDFSIRINSSLLSDVKYEKRKDYRDNY